MSPERLKNPVFIRFVQKVRIDFIAIDEAHCISMWGYDFRPVYLDIIKFIKGLKKRPVIGVYTATATPVVIDDIVKMLKLDKKSSLKGYSLVQGSCERKNLSFSVKNVNDRDEKRKFIMEYLDCHKEQCGIIYCSTKDETQNLYDYLIQKGLNVAIYHSTDENLDVKSAEKNQKMFMCGKCRIMVATSAFGMGINKKDVRFVIHYNMPKDIESYYQEAGRAGRDNKKAECIILYFKKGKKNDYSICEGFLENFRKNSDFDKEITKYHYKLGKYRLECMQQYCEMAGSSSQELQDYIVGYFRAGLPLELSPEKNVSNKQKLIEERIRKIAQIYYNNTRIANEIRKGEYEIGKEKEINCGRSRIRELSIGVKTVQLPKTDLKVSYLLENENNEKITYFDMMIADAVYTLAVNLEKVIYPKKIYELLSGDVSVTLKPDKKIAIERSLDKMIRTNIRINKSPTLFTDKVFEEDRIIIGYSGKFLPLTKRNNSGYKIDNIPPLYMFATAFNINGQFLTFAEKELCVLNKTDIKLPASEENSKIIYYLLARIKTMSSTNRGSKALVGNSRRGLSRKLRYDTLLKVTDIKMPEDKYSWKRKYELLFGTAYYEKINRKGIIQNRFTKIKSGKIDIILDYFLRMGLITGYENQVDTYNAVCGKETLVNGVVIDFM